MVFAEHVSASENLEHDCLVTQESLADNNCPAHSDACATGEAIHEAKTRIASLHSKVITQSFSAATGRLPQGDQHRRVKFTIASSTGSDVHGHGDNMCALVVVVSGS